MQAAVINFFDKSKDAFEIIDVPEPVITDDEAMIKVKATSINPIDYKMRGGHLPHLVKHFPAILHGDVSGIVEQVGSKVTEFKIGDEVYGCIGGVIGIDVVFDTIGNQNLPNSFETVKRKGIVVTTVSLGTTDISLIHEKALEFHTVYMIIPILYKDEQGKTEHGQILKQITALVDQGKVIPLIDEKKFSLEDIAQAHDYADTGKNLGKVVISLDIHEH